ncbi:MAG: SAM-dependent methyltransferase [Alphaproteobacteria bacterium]|jgi:SAM-dependent methyltransferase|nr:SAM-dependent methyltransferase [Alphaproteobacteria bacterium]MDP6622278.1 SAM-dependent methyltransferase [Alphaproteobacteria bacterium]|tara:strand:- start:1567 stop:2151 length:585 start_codon:yes stop_codon:yes gene_type:complete
MRETEGQEKGATPTRRGLRQKPSHWVEKFAPLVPAGGLVLDLAAGSGRHSRLFLGRGHAVTAIDRDLSKLPPQNALERHEHDLEDGRPWPLGGRSYAAIVVTNYLYRPLFPDLLASLESGGLLIYETFAQGNERFGRPRNPDHLLGPGELLELVGDLTVLAYEHGEVTEPWPAVVQRIAARALKDGPKDRGDGG